MSERPKLNLEEQKEKILQTSAVRGERKKKIRRSLSELPFNDDGVQDVLDKISGYLKITMEEWKNNMDEFHEEFGLTVDNHQPVYYAVKLWNALVESRSS